MSIGSRLTQWILRLPPAKTRDILVERDIKIPMHDGIELLADRHYPRGADKVPTVLVRSCYGKSGFIGFLNGRLLAERGFQVLIQNCRGTFGSGGRLNPFHQERGDGLATLEWIRKQPWFSGELPWIRPVGDRRRCRTGSEGHVGPGYRVRVSQSNLCRRIIRYPRSVGLGLRDD